MHLFGVMSFAEEAETVDHWQPPLFFGCYWVGHLDVPTTVRWIFLTYTVVGGLHVEI